MQRNISILFAQINEHLSHASFDNEDPHIFQRLADIHETLSALMAICELYLQHLNPVIFKKHLTELFAARAPRIVNSPLCYTLEPRSVMNSICMLLAEFCDSEQYCQLLLPDVAVEDIYSNNINEIKIGNFILTDDGKQFIHLEGVVETTFARMDAAETELYLTTDAKGRERPLTSSEFERLGNISQRLSDIHKQMHAKGFWQRWFQSNQNRVYDELKRLRAGLRRGDVRHQGEELNAGSDANVAIVNFKNFYDKLSPSKRQEMEAIGDGHENLGSIFNLLFRDPNQANSNNGMTVNYCIAIIGGHLDSSLTNNHQQLMGISLDQQEAIGVMKNELISDIKNGINIKLGGGFVRPINEQRAEFCETISRKLAPMQDVYATCLRLFINFVENEIGRHERQESNVKRSLYIQILAKLIIESVMIDTQGDSRKTRILVDVFTAISRVAASTPSWISIKTPDSQKNWHNFLHTHHVLRLYPFEYNDNPAIAAVKEICLPAIMQQLEIPEIFIDDLHRHETNKEFQEWADNHPISAIFVSYTKPIMDYIVGHGKRLQRDYRRDPNKFFEQHPREVAGGALAAVTALAGTMWVVNRLM